LSTLHLKLFSSQNTILHTKSRLSNWCTQLSITSEIYLQ